MNKTRPNASGLPSIPLTWAFPALPPGATIPPPPAFGAEPLITNGPAIAVIFTDEKGQPIHGEPRCGMDPDATPLPPCNLTLHLNGSKTRLYVSGTLSPGLKPGTYTFYICAQNVVGWSNVCVCTLPIESKTT